MYYHLTVRQRRIAAVALIFLGIGLFLRIRSPRWDSLTSRFPEEQQTTSSQMQKLPDDEGDDVRVHVMGAVVRPGVYSLPAGARVADAIERAGGSLSTGDQHALNLAAKVADGDRIEVPRINDKDVEEKSGGRVNINTADSEELQQLYGIGPVLAEEIIALRRRLGEFEAIEQLLEVPGIGPVTLERIRDEITLR
ncbi:MAG: helix-hairpin-helix domain-containing protein [Clostridia bacterium]